MNTITHLVRKNVLQLKPYSSARDEFKGLQGIFMDANENPFGSYNRYPDPYQMELKHRLSELKNISTDGIFIGNGSDEVIDLAIRIFCYPQQDRVIICPPTYGMYEVLANVNDIAIINISLTTDFQLDIKKILQTDAKMLFLCSPNNPTGNVFEQIELILSNFNGIVFLDEAYIDFSTQPSFIHLLPNYPNLIVSQTLSKAWGLAGIRIGMAFANKEIIQYFNKIKPPYNVSLINYQTALTSIQHIEEWNQNKEIILTQKQWLIQELSLLKFVKKIYPTETNFILIEVDNANQLYHYLVQQQVIVRNRDTLIKNCLRITIGKPAENECLLNHLKTYTK